MSQRTITREAYERLQTPPDAEVSWPHRRYHLGDHVVVHDPDPEGPWFVRWCTPDGHSRGSMKLTDIDPKADPMDREAARELACWMATNHVDRLWFVSNEQALVVLP